MSDEKNTKTLEQALEGHSARARGVRAGAGLDLTQLRRPVAVPRGAQSGAADAAWASLREVSVPQSPGVPSCLSKARSDPAAAAAFDLLRTRILQALRAHGWHRVAITSPTPGCGKSFVTANLAASLSRAEACRSVVLDLDMHAPRLGPALGLPAAGRIAGFLNGEVEMNAHLLRVGGNLALGLNATVEPDAAERLQQPATARALDAMQAALQPDVVLFDLPPMLGGADVPGFLPHVDALLLIADATRTRGEEIAACEALLGDHTQSLGVILNKVDSAGPNGADHAAI